jgi:uncharacterized membrane protein YccC
MIDWAFWTPLLMWWVFGVSVGLVIGMLASLWVWTRKDGDNG